MKKCVSKEQFDCIYLTKENRDEVFKILEPKINDESIFIKEDNDKYCFVEHLGKRRSKRYYYYNYWCVLGAEGDYLWEQYSPKEFEEMFKLVE